MGLSSSISFGYHGTLYFVPAFGVYLHMCTRLGILIPDLSDVFQHNYDESTTAMVSLTILSASKPPSFARGFPLTIEVTPEATVADVKASITAKFPKVRVCLGSCAHTVKCTLLRVHFPRESYLLLITINSSAHHAKRFPSRMIKRRLRMKQSWQTCWASNCMMVNFK